MTTVTGKRTATKIEAGWTFRQAGAPREAGEPGGEALPVAQFPTNVHLDLLHHGLIPDPYVGKNEQLVQWVGERDWVYRTAFASPPSRVAGEVAVLAFEGLDTYATVVLNGEEILRTENMHVPERVEVTGLLARDGGANELVITFESAFLRGKKVEEAHPDHKWGCWNGDRSRLGVRKAQYHYGWDWGPVLLTAGPWRPVVLETYASRIADVWVETDVPGALSSATVHAQAEVEGSAGRVRFEMVPLSGSAAAQVAPVVVNVVEGRASHVFAHANPELWYPHGYGKQPLYTVTATLLSDGGEPVDVVEKKFGIRRARVVQRPLKDQPGSTFFFEINNIPIFVGGSNWIPADNFIPRIGEQKYRDWLQLLVDGNQTMARVWGGGIYEEDIFYTAADELGILVWQDFLFGCGNYPAFPSLLASIEREATANVTRLRHHPCIVIYAGNNEDYQYMESEALEYDPADANPDNWLKTTFPARYIYEKLLVDVTKKLVPNTYYHFGSPYGGKDSRDATVGDIHQWNVWHGTQEKYQDFDALAGRFVSEFGMEAFPDIRTIESYLPRGAADPDRFAQSATVDFHNKADGHERRIALYLVENITYTFHPFEQFIYSTQLMQSECLSSAYRLWRRNWKGPGREYTGGALVWQINDCWPVTSWAIVDYHLRPKLAYYTIKHELSPLVVGVKRVTTSVPRDKYTRVDIATTHTLQIWASSSHLHDLAGISLVVKAYDVVTGEERYKAVLTPDGGVALAANQTTELADILVPGTGSAAPSEDEIRGLVHVVYLVDGDGRQVARRVSWPEPLKYVHLQRPRGLKVEWSGKEGRVLVSSDVPVKGFALEVKEEGVVVLDNCVDVVPGEVVSLGVKGVKAGRKIGEVLGWRYLGYEA
ncbi:family 2 glycosyl hydrolase [Peziza echinospora]|nr:family 2 glycosyl hydrolase [Peziza echinospora]